MNQQGGLSVLKTFPTTEGLPFGDEEQYAAFNSPEVEEVICFALGPEGTNIGQSCQQWIKRTGIKHKSRIIYCETPWKALERARAIERPGCVPTFWTCAVYYDLFHLFFRSPDAYTLFVIEPMLLDEMQLAVRPELAEEIVDGVIPKGWSIASHPSPAPLVEHLSATIKLVDSNAQAAMDCSDGLHQMCVTTESARNKHGLVKAHSFGSPMMVFFGGVAGGGLEVLRKAHVSAVGPQQLAMAI